LEFQYYQNSESYHVKIQNVMIDVESGKERRCISFYDKTTEKQNNTHIFLRHRDDFIKQLKYEQYDPVNNLQLKFDPTIFIIKEELNSDNNRLYEHIMSYIFTHELIQDENYNESSNEDVIHEFDIKSGVGNTNLNSLEPQLSFKLMFIPRKALYGINFYPVIRIGKKITLLMFTMASTIECNHFLKKDKHQTLLDSLTYHTNNVLTKSNFQICFDQTLLPMLSNGNPSKKCIVCLANAKIIDSHGNLFCSERDLDYYHS
jgi:hypothetical protein